MVTSFQIIQYVKNTAITMPLSFAINEPNGTLNAIVGMKTMLRILLTSDFPALIRHFQIYVPCFDLFY